MSNSVPWRTKWPHIPMRSCSERKFCESAYAVDLCQIVHTAGERYECRVGTAADEKAALMEVSRWKTLRSPKTDSYGSSGICGNSSVRWRHDKVFCAIFYSNVFFISRNLSF